ncbi:MAG: hypothetical protein Q8Q09_21225 [Deltaproteobacteria bacterium]|nr:hypothetical protein [Deltaproteobacteria bacterium]
MTHRKNTLRKLTLAVATLALGLTGSVAMAQSLSQGPSAQGAEMAHGRRGEGRHNRTPIAFSPTSAQGTISRFVVGPMGRTQAIVLSSGHIVHLGRHGDESSARLAVGATVRVSGFAAASAPLSVMGATVSDTSGNVIVQANPRAIARFSGTAAAPAAGQHPGRHQGRGMRQGHHGEHMAAMAALPARSARGTVQTLLVGPRGHVRGALLSDGTSVFFGRGLHRAASDNNLAVGQLLVAEGRGNQYARGASVMAERVTFANGVTVTAERPEARNGAQRGHRGEGRRAAMRRNHRAL